VQRTLVLVLTTLAFVAALFVVPPMAAARSQKGDAAIGAARLAMVHVAKPVVRKAERTPGPAMAPRVFSVEPATFAALEGNSPPKQWTPDALDRSVLMVFLN
jgi:hypothetical protein